MFRRFSANFAVFSIFLDIVCIDLAVFLSTKVRLLLNPLSFVADVPAPIYFPWSLYIIFPILWIITLLLCSVYDGRKNLKAINEFSSLTLATILAAIASAGILYFSYRDVSRFLFVLAVVICWFFLLLWRSLIRLVYRSKRFRASQTRKALILGTGEVAKKIQSEIASRSSLGLKLEGFLDDRDPSGIKMKVLGRIEDVRAIVKSKDVDDVIIALPRSKDEQLNQVVAELHDLPVRVWVIPDYFSLTLHKATIENIGGMPMLDLRAPALSEYQRMVKRAFDLISCLLFMLVALPIMGISAIAILVDSRGPILYRSKRVGENGRLFDMLKFRTMVKDADKLRSKVIKIDEKGHMFHKLREDPRITRVGKFLRKTSIDELPQLFNIFIGEMSFVGPRPEMPWLVEKYELWQRKRFAVPQGLTGWWQVNGRSDKPMHLNTQDDLYYVQNYSIWLDIKILLLTLGVVIRGKGAF